MLLPYIDQASLYNQFDLEEATSQFSNQSSTVDPRVAGDPATNGNGALAETELEAFTCPSDGYTLKETPSTSYGVTLTTASPQLNG